jgi:hypothetical protein
VETTTLARTDPPLPTYQHHLQDAVGSGALSSLQIETVIYACQRHNVTLDSGQGPPDIARRVIESHAEPSCV